MENATLSILLLFSLFLCSIFSQQDVWTQLNPSNPPPVRSGHIGVYDSSSNSMLVFGGQGSSGDLNDLWSYNISSNTWTQLNPSNPLPDPRSDFCGIYISSSDTMLIFGGSYEVSFLNDLWSYSILSNSWTQLNTSNPPTNRFGHSGVYDSSSNSMLIFGGQGSSGLFNDLWKYDISSNSWTQLTPSNPPVRVGHSAIYLTSSNSMLIFGGQGSSGYLNDLWSYSISSNSWTQSNTSNPPVRKGHSAIYLTSSNSMLIFGGQNISATLNDLWNYTISSNTWTQLNPSSPLPSSRSFHSAIYVPSSTSMLIFAGYNSVALNDLWCDITLPQTTSQQTTTQQQTTVQQTTSQQTTIQQQTTVQQTTSQQTTIQQQTTVQQTASQQTTSQQISEIIVVQTNDNALIGGIVGGFFGLALIGCILLAIFLLKRKKAKKENQPQQLELNVTIENSTTDYVPFQLEPHLLKNLNSFGFIIFSDLQFDNPRKILGQGAFGIVYKGKYKGQYVAIKEINGNIVNEKEIEAFIKEAELMRTLPKHSNVLNLIGISLQPFCIITGFMERGDLSNYLKMNQTIDDKQKLKWMIDICSGMEHLAKHHIIHRDLAARNCLLDSVLNAKISDFGLARIADTSNQVYSKSDVGPLKWMSVEAMSNKTYSEKSDVWSFGITCIEILTQDKPYPYLEALQAASQVLKGLRPTIPDGTNPDLEKILNSCWGENPENRPTFSQLLTKLQTL